MHEFRKLMFAATWGAALLIPQASRAEVFTQADITQIFNEVKTLDQTGARPSKMRETIQGIQSVKTGAQSRAELTFPDKSLTRLGGNTIFSFQQGTRELELKQGTILFEVPKGNGGAKIRTAAITAAITGTTGFYEFSPKAGTGGIIKFGILEGSANLYIKGRLGHFITVGEGQMVICPANLRDFNSTDVVYFDIQDFVRTCALINKMGGLPNNSPLLVNQAIARQGRLYNRSKELFLTNLFIPGGGTEVVLTDIDRRMSVNFPATPFPTPTAAPRTSGPSPTYVYNTPYPALPLPPSTPSKYGPLQTITNPDPYVINTTTQILLDPKITMNGVDNFGTIFRNASQDGALSDYQFGSTSTFDQTSGYGTRYLLPSGGIANFKFSDLVISGQPSITQNGGPADLALISVGPITSALPHGSTETQATINLDALNGLFLGTVNGSITLGPELAFTSSASGTQSGSYDYTNQGYTKGLYLELYARGASSDVVLGSSVAFTGTRGLFLEAEHNVEVSGSINAPFVAIQAGNNFLLDSTATITANTFQINNATDVTVGGSAFVSATEADITLSNAVTVVQGTNYVNVNALPLDINALQTLNVTSSAITVPGDISTANLQNLTLNSNNANLVINGQISVDNFTASAPDLSPGTGAGVNAFTVSLNLFNANAVISQGGIADLNSPFTVNNLSFNADNLYYLYVQAQNITLPHGFSFIGGDLYLFSDTDSITSTGDLIASYMGLYSTTNVTGNVTVDNDLTVYNLTASGDVSANTITANSNFVSITANSINAPGGLQGFNGYNGGDKFGPGAGATLTLTSNVQPVAFAIPNATPRPVIGSSTFNGGDALATSPFAGGDGGSLTVNANAGISVEVPLSATTGANGNSVATGGAGGTVNLTSNNGPVNVSASIDVSSDDSAHHVSASGGNINIQSGMTRGTAINVTNSGALRALLNAAAPGPGGTVQITSAGGDIIFNGGARADRGTVLIQNNGSGNIAMTGAVVSADIVKIGALGDSGQLTIGGGSINANTLMKLYAGGSNGTVNFVDNVTLNGGTKIIAGNTITIQNGKIVTVNGSTANVYGNTLNYSGAGGNTSTTGRFSGPGAPTTGTTHGLSGAPSF